MSPPLGGLFAFKAIAPLVNKSSEYLEHKELLQELPITVEQVPKKALLYFKFLKILGFSFKWLSLPFEFTTPLFELH